MLFMPTRGWLTWNTSLWINYIGRQDYAGTLISSSLFPGGSYTESVALLWTRMLHTTLFFFRKALYIYLSKTSAAIWVIMMRHRVIEAATVPLLRMFCTTHFWGIFFTILLSQHKYHWSGTNIQHSLVFCLLSQDWVGTIWQKFKPKN